MQKYKIKSGFIVRELAGEVLIVPNDPDSQIQNSMMEPNETAASIWRAFTETSTIDDVVQKLLLEYEVEEAVAKKAVEQFVQESINLGILEKVE